MESATTFQFARAARILAGEARRAGLVVPGFRCPPRLAGVNRTLRRRGSSVVVAIRLRDRPWVAVLGDLVEGIVVSNQLVGAEADRVRSRLWQVVEAEVSAPVERARVA